MGPSLRILAHGQHSTLSICLLLLGLLLAILLLHSRQAKHLADAALHGLPRADITVLVPRQRPNPRLHIVVQTQLDVVGLANLAAGVGDLILGTLVLDGELATVIREI